MASKTKASEGKTAVLKGKEAEDKVLEYMKRMNRPFGAVDVSANLKGAVPKTAAQKILVTLSERGDLVQKTCGKTTFFVANQANLENLPSQKLVEFEAEFKKIDDGNKALAGEVRSLGADLAKLKGSPTDDELAVEIEKIVIANDKARAHLEPLRSGMQLISAEETSQLDADWDRWRREWVRRRKVFHTFWSLATDALAPQQATELADDLGVELDTPEHIAVERGALCLTQAVLGKRRR